MVIILATKVSKINKELTSFSKTKILKTLNINAKAIKNKEYFKNLTTFFLWWPYETLISKTSPIIQNKKIIFHTFIIWVESFCQLLATVLFMVCCVGFSVKLINNYWIKSVRKLSKFDWNSNKICTVLLNVFYKANKCC